MNEPLFLRAAAAAKLCCRSEGSWWRLNREKKNPASFKMGGTTFWHRAEILKWIEASCPERDAWEVMRKAGA